MARVSGISSDSPVTKKTSAGILLFRRVENEVEVFLVHPGGPFWARKDAGAWSIPKGEYDPTEDPLAAALREFTEETGFDLSGDFIELTPQKQAGGKIVRAWALEGDCDPANIVSNTFSLEWPPKSGKHVDFPEIDRAGWFSIVESKAKILKGQIGFIEELAELMRR